MVRPSKSLVVVMKGPEARAGLNPNRLIMMGVIVPTKDENKTTQNKAKETMIDSLLLLKNR